MESQEDNYQPGTDQNQGVVGQMARAEQNGPFDPMENGASQADQFDSNDNTNEEAARQELGADATNDDMLTEEAIEDGDITVEGTAEEQASFDGPDF